MRYGVCTWVFGQMPLEEVAFSLAHLGYDGVELLGDWTRYPPQESNRILADQGLAVLSLTPADVDLAHPDEKTRGEALSYFRGLLDYAVELKAPIVSCHGAVGRVRAVTTQQQEETLLLDGVRELAPQAESLGIRIAMEVLNRYESHLLNTAVQARQFVDAVDSPAVGILLDTYHMNIEEADPVEALKVAGDKLFLFHVADSNRRAVGRGHVPFSSLFQALMQMRYASPIVVECTAPGPNPFTPEKGPDWHHQVLEEVGVSLKRLRELEQASR